MKPPYRLLHVLVGFVLYICGELDSVVAYINFALISQNNLTIHIRQWRIMTQIERHVGPMLAQRGADRIYVGPTWGQRNLLSGVWHCYWRWNKVQRYMHFGRNTVISAVIIIIITIIALAFVGISMIVIVLKSSIYRKGMKKINWENSPQLFEVNVT